MSYRSIKRVLGETSLERKCRFLFGGCLLTLITASFAWHNAMTEDLVLKQNRTTGRLLADQVMFIEHWKGLQILDDDRYKDLVQSLSKKFNKDDYQWHYILPNSVDGKGVPRDEYEWKLLDYFPKSVPANGDDDIDLPKFAERRVPDRNEYRYYQPIRAERDCLACHVPPLGGSGLDTTGTGVALSSSGVWRGGMPLSEGDLMAIVRVTIPYGPIQHAMNINRASLLATAIITVFLAMIGSYMIIRYVIVKPLRHLRDVSDAISHGNIALRADIHTGDEFEGLASAFNRMLRHLVAIQEELRHVNVDLDVKVDELAQANMRLYELNCIKSDFLATMSHELRTPLNSILGFSDVLRSIDALDEKQKRYVENIRKSGRILLDMINDILDLAKIESGKMQPRLTDFRLEQVVGAQCDMARPLTEKKNIDLEVVVDPDAPPMHQDQARVQQVLNNLLSNAIKFTPEGGRIKVVAQRDEYDCMVMEVIDTGVGIAEEDQQAIFEKFRQGRTGLPGSDAMTREYSGTGLGLSIVRELCRLLGGEVTVQSTLGQGSTFTVRLPWRLEDHVSMEPPPNEALEDFAKTRFEVPRDATDGTSPVSEPQAT